MLVVVNEFDTAECLGENIGGHVISWAVAIVDLTSTGCVMQVHEFDVVMFHAAVVGAG